MPKARIAAEANKDAAEAEASRLEIEGAEKLRADLDARLSAAEQEHRDREATLIANRDEGLKELQDKLDIATASHKGESSQEAAGRGSETELIGEKNQKKDGEKEKKVPVDESYEELLDQMINWEVRKKKPIGKAEGKLKHRGT